MKVLAIGATNSKKSMNKQLATYVAGLIEDSEVETLDLNDYEMPIYSVDREQESGIHELAKTFFNKIADSDAIVISFAEYNGSYSSAYKNIFDWCSRIDMKVFQNKPVILLSASPGPGGATSVLASAVGSAPFFGADVKGSLSFPSFYENFDSLNKVVINNELKSKIIEITKKIPCLA